MDWRATYCSTNFALQDPQPSEPSDGPSPSKRFACHQVGCKRQFARKEHLNRHLKSHSPVLKHTCQLCDKKFARSDVLKRHIENHPRSNRSRRTVVACDGCHERKMQCDDDTPCRSCARSSTQCVRNKPNPTSHTHPYGAAGDGEDITVVSNGIQLSTLPPASAGGEIPAIIGAENSQTWKPSTTVPWYQNPFPPAESIIIGGYDNGDLNELNWAPNGEIFPSQSGLNVPPTYDAPVEIQSRISHAGSNISPSSYPTQSSNSTVISSSSSTLSSDPVSLLTLASSISSHEDSTPKLDDSLNTTSPTIKRYFETYFTKIHPTWPILHEPSFEIGKVTPNLRTSMIILASYHEGGDHHEQIAPILFEAVLAAHLEPEPSLQNMQALLLCVIYALQLLTVDNMLAKALHLNSVLVSTCRYRGVFNGEFDYHESGDDDPVKFWLLQEQVRRLAYAVLQVDAYLCIISDHPQSVHYQEMTIPLPKSARLWAAVTSQQRRQLQWTEPGGREKDMFSTIMRDTLDIQRQDHNPRQLSAVDYHLLLCALQTGCWDAAREAHSAASDEFDTKRSPGSPIEIWRTHLSTWRQNVEKECQLRQTYFSPNLDSHLPSCAPLSLILWHTSVMKMHAPLDLLQRFNYHTKRKHRNDPSTRQLECHLRTWLASTCPRLAVWNAAQIIRVIVGELERPPDSDRLRLNPLAGPCLLMSAIVVCAYAKYTKACSMCSIDFESRNVDLFEADDGDEQLVEWKSSGNGVAYLGSRGIVCQCGTTELIAFFKQHLSIDEKLEKEFTSFTSDLV